MKKVMFVATFTGIGLCIGAYTHGGFSELLPSAVVVLGMIVSLYLSRFIPTFD